MSAVESLSVFAGHTQPLPLTSLFPKQGQISANELL